MTKNKVTNRTKAGLGGIVALIISAVVLLEGGYVNDPVDPGGETNHGITKNVAVQHGYTGDMRDLKVDCEIEGQVCATSIYAKSYIEKPGFLPIIFVDPAVGEEVVDTGVNMGPRRPSRYFQRALNDVCDARVAADGVIGPKTVGAWLICRLERGEQVCVAMLDSLDRQQEAEYDRLVRVNPSLKRFRRGWQNHRIGNVDRDKCKESAT